MIGDHPFKITPDSRFFFRGRSADASYESLLSGVREHQGVMLLVGDAGTGKTTILLNLQEDLRRSGCLVVYPRRPMLSFDELIEACCEAAGVVKAEIERTGKVRAFTDLLVKQAGDGGTTAVFIDDAHTISDQFLIDLSRLTNVEKDGAKLLQVVLAGQIELVNRLTAAELPLVQECAFAYRRLDPLSKAEVEPYIDYRLARVGHKGPRFSPKAVKRIARLSGGTPQVVNQLCAMGLQMAILDGSEAVGAEQVDSVALDLFSEGADDTSDETAPVDDAPEAQADQLAPADVGESEGDEETPALPTGPDKAERKKAWLERAFAADAPESEEREMLEPGRETDPKRRAPASDPGFEGLSIDWDSLQAGLADRGRRKFEPEPPTPPSVKVVPLYAGTAMAGPLPVRRADRRAASAAGRRFPVAAMFLIGVLSGGVGVIALWATGGQHNEPIAQSNFGQEPALTRLDPSRNTGGRAESAPVQGAQTVDAGSSDRFLGDLEARPAAVETTPSNAGGLAAVGQPTVEEPTAENEGERFPVIPEPPKIKDGKLAAFTSAGEKLAPPGGAEVASRQPVELTVADTQPASESQGDAVPEVMPRPTTVQGSDGGLPAKKVVASGDRDFAHEAADSGPAAGLPTPLVPGLSDLAKLDAPIPAAQSSRRSGSGDVANIGMPTSLLPEKLNAGPPSDASEGKFDAGDGSVTVESSTDLTARPEQRETAAPVTVAAAGGGDYTLQLASLPSRQEAEQERERLAERHGDILGVRKLTIEVGEVQGRAFYRVRSPALENGDLAYEACARLMARGQRCMVLRRGSAIRGTEPVDVNGTGVKVAGAIGAAAAVESATASSSQSFAAESDLAVLDFLLTRDVEGREPVGETDRFVASDREAYVYARIRNPGSPTKIEFLWRKDQALVSRYRATVGTSGRWRTWSSVEIWPGEWSVALVKEGGELLAETSFVVE